MKKHSASRSPTRTESGTYRSTSLSSSRNPRRKHRVYPPLPPSTKATKATIGIHPNIPISVRDLSPDRYYSVSSSRGTSRRPPTPASSTGSRDDDLESVTSKETTAYYKGCRQSQLTAEDAEYARRLEKEEQRRKEKLDRKFAEARRLADKWAREEETARIRAQTRLAERLEQEERVAAERRRRNREAARRAQEQWEAASVARETEIRRAEERRRREEIEERRVGEEQRRVQIERERGWAQEASERNRLIAGEKKRREQQNIAEGLRRQAQANNKRRDAEPPKQVDCVSCMDPWDERDVAVLPCDHAYCEKCIKGMYCPFHYEIPAQEYFFSLYSSNSFPTSRSSAAQLC